ncbi:MAG: hypothetical protein NVSMB42_19690 [Herpetosiphon sp.]
MAKAIQQDYLWSQAAHDWAELEEPAGWPLWETMLDAVAVEPGMQVLDVGCGAGSASAYAAARGARVNGVDLAESLIMIARRRVPDADFRVCDVAALPYADRVFDAVMAANVLQYVTEPRAVLREIHRVCAPGARVAVAVWDAPAMCDLYALWQEIGQTLSLSIEAPVTLSQPNVLAALLNGAGLQFCHEYHVAYWSTYPDRETAWQAIMSSGPLQAVRCVVGTPRLRGAVLQALAPHVLHSGEVCLRNCFRVAIGLCIPADCPTDEAPPGGGKEGNSERSATNDDSVH